MRGNDLITLLAVMAASWLRTRTQQVAMPNGHPAARLISLLLTDNSDPILSRDHCLQPWYMARHLIMALLLALVGSADSEDFQSVLRGAQIEVRCDNERAHQDQAGDSCHREPPLLQEC
jgi:hypothetical protein